MALSLGIDTADFAIGADVVDLIQLDAGGGHLIQGGLQIGNDQPKTLCRTRSSRRTIPAELHGATRAWRRKLDHAGRRGIQSPSEALIEHSRAFYWRRGPESNRRIKVLQTLA